MIHKDFNVHFQQVNQSSKMQVMFIMVMNIYYDIKLLIYINLWLILVGFYSLNYRYTHIYVPFVANTCTVNM